MSSVLTVIVITFVIVSVLYALSMLGGVLYFAKGYFKRFYHDIMGWHMPDNSEKFDGCSFHSHCKYCGKEITQDSQGNWF